MAEVEELNPAAEESEVAAQPPSPRQFTPLWRNRDYMLLWSGQVVSTLGSTASFIVFPLLILAITNSPSRRASRARLARSPTSSSACPRVR